MQNVKIRIDGIEVYTGKITENAKIEIQRDPQKNYTKDYPKKFSSFGAEVLDALGRYDDHVRQYKHCSGSMWVEYEGDLLIKIPNLKIGYLRALGLID